jgi:hypothetical protein
MIGEAESATRVPPAGLAQTPSGVTATVSPGERERLTRRPVRAAT